METLQETEFTNRRNEQVRIVLMADSFGGYHLITKVKMLRNTEEPRFINGAISPLKVRTFTEETSITYTEIRKQAENEFRLHRVMHADPNYSNEEFQKWQRETEDKESN